MQLILRLVPWAVLSCLIGLLPIRADHAEFFADDPLLRSLPADLAGGTPPTPWDRSWTDWMGRTGESAPDFDALPSQPFLPDPLRAGFGGQQILTSEAWQDQRASIEREIQHWVSGTLPPPPEDWISEVIDSQLQADGVRVESIEMRFGPQRKTRMRLELYLPPGEGTRPVFMTQWNHAGWARVAVRRGYIGCRYAGADGMDDTEAYGEIWPEYDFSRLMRRAWGAMRVLDYLLTRPEVAPDQIVLSGHSRNGKQSLLAAAFDPRFAAVVSSSGGTGGEQGFRFTGPRYNNESIEEITNEFPSWFHPRLRFFSGREHKLPVDQNSLMALIAPRGLMLAGAATEHEGSAFGIQQVYESVHSVYQFLGAPDRVALDLRQGQHSLSTRDIERYIDFFDFVLGRSERKPENRKAYPFDFDEWRQRSGDRIDLGSFPVNHHQRVGEHSPDRASWRQERLRIQEQIRWLMGEEPAGVQHAGPGNPRQGRRSDDFVGEIIGRPTIPSTQRVVLGPYRAPGDDLWANLYLPADRGETPSLPVVVYLHGYSYSSGWARRIEPFLEALTRRGVAVLALDSIGFGTRIEEGTHFYQRYPRWSKLGRMVADVRAVVDTLSQFDGIDPEQIWLAGASLGGTVALFSAALDDRVAGVAAESAFTPMREFGAEREGLLAYSHQHGLLPRLGFFAEDPARVPVDFDGILACLAPRHLFLRAPAHDWHSDREGVRNTVDSVRGRWALFGADANLVLEEVDEYQPFFHDGPLGAAVQNQFAEALLNQIGR